MVGLKIDPLLTNRVLVFNAKLIIGRRSAKDLINQDLGFDKGHWFDADVTKIFLHGI